MSLNKDKIKRLHAVAARNGLIESGDRSNLKALIHAQTGKEHVSELTDKEFAAVYSKILTMAKGSVPGMMRDAQIKKAWALMYQLCELNPREGVDVRMRMAGAIKTILKVEAPQCGDIFRWVPETMGRKLIENLKRYVETERRKHERMSG